MPSYEYIRTKEDVKLLSLYAIDLMPCPVTFEDVVDLVTICDHGFSWFELKEGFDELVASGHLEQTAGDGEPRYQVNDRGRSACAVFINRLPYTVRRAAQESAQRVLRRIHRDAVITAESSCAGRADYPVTLGLDDLFRLQLHAVSEEQAAVMTRNFRAHAEEIYLDIIKALTGETSEK